MFGNQSNQEENPFEEMIMGAFERLLTPHAILYPVKILVCDDNTTVFWNNGKSTQVKRMAGAINSTEDAIAFALVKYLTADWIDTSEILCDEDDTSIILDNGRRNWMKTALKKVEVLPSRKELRQLKLESKKDKTNLLPANVGKPKDVAKEEKAKK